jgi:hypothetical protein
LSRLKKNCVVSGKKKKRLSFTKRRRKANTIKKKKCISLNLKAPWHDLYDEREQCWRKYSSDLWRQNSHLQGRVDELERELARQRADVQTSGALSEADQQQHINDLSKRVSGLHGQLEEAEFTHANE